MTGKSPIYWRSRGGIVTSRGFFDEGICHPEWRANKDLHSSHMRLFSSIHLKQHVEGRGDAPPHPTSIPNVSSTCAIRNKLFNFVGACLAAAVRCHLDKAQFVRCGGGIGSHFDEDISRASESRALLFSSMTTHLTSEWMDGIDRPGDSRIYGPAGRTPFIEIAHCISFVSSRGRGRASF